MKAMRSAIATLLAVPVLAGCSGDPDSGPTPSPSGSTPPQATLWSARLPGAAVSGEDVTNPISAGERLLVLAGDRMTAYDRKSGKVGWKAPLGPGVVCGDSSAVGSDGVVAVLSRGASSTTCTHLTAIDAATGRRLWTARIPAKTGSLRHAKVAIGSSTVTVTGYCAGFARFDASSGRVASVVHGDCRSDSVSDGRTIVVAEQNATGGGRTRVSLYDAATGRRRSRAVLERAGRPGEVVSSDPLVVTERTNSHCALADLSATTPKTFGLRDLTSGSFGAVTGCEVPGAARVGDILWLEGADMIAGYDLAHHRDVGHGSAGSGEMLLGAAADRLILADNGAGSAGAALLAVTAGGRPAEFARLAGPVPPQCPSTTTLSKGCTALVGDEIIVLDGQTAAAYRVPPG